MLGQFVPVVYLDNHWVETIGKEIIPAEKAHVALRKKTTKQLTHKKYNKFSKQTSSKKEKPAAPSAGCLQMSKQI